MKPCWAQYVLWFCVALAGTGALLSACGQKGDLYLPEEAADQAAEGGGDAGRCGDGGGFGALGEDGGDLGRGAEAVVRVLGEEAQDGVFEVLGEIGAVGAGWDRWCVQVLGEDGEGVVAIEGQAAGGELVEHDAESADVRAPVDVAAPAEESCIWAF